jgi:hypothetical protein
MKRGSWATSRRLGTVHNVAGKVRLSVAITISEALMEGIAAS